MRQIAGSADERENPLRAEAIVTETPDHQFTLRLVVRSGALTSARDLKARSCGDLVGALAITLALLLGPEEPTAEGRLAESEDPSASSPPGPPPPNHAPTTTSPPEKTTLSDGEQGSPPERVRRWRALLTLPMVALGFGPQRHVSTGLGVAAGLSFDEWRVQPEGKLWTSRNATPWPGEEYGATLKQWTMTLRGCRRIWGDRFELSPCLILSLQHLSARGTGPNIAAQTPRAMWAAAGLGLRARYLATPWLGLVGSADAEVQLSQPEVKLGGVGSVERLYPVGATVTLGCEWIL